MSDRLQRISDNAGRIYATLLNKVGGAEGAVEEAFVSAAVHSAISIEQEVVKQVRDAFTPHKEPV